MSKKAFAVCRAEVMQPVLFHSIHDHNFASRSLSRKSLDHGIVGMVIYVLLLCLIAASCSIARADSAPEPIYRIYATSDVEHDVPTDRAETEFTCTDMIFVVVEAYYLPPEENYQLHMVWGKPSGKEAKETRIDLPVSESITRTWVWLRLSRGAGGSLMSLIDSAAGFHEFVGEWRVKVYINNKPVGESRFEIIC